MVSEGAAIQSSGVSAIGLSVGPISWTMAPSSSYLIVVACLLPSVAALLVAPLRPLPAVATRACSPSACAPLTTTVKHFIEDLEFLGPCRFVVIGPGAILEAIGEFTDLRTDEAKGLATVSTDTGFECHIRLGEVKKAAFATKDGKDKTMHIIRLLGEEDKSLLSVILSPETPGESVDEGAIEYWTKLRARFGDTVELAAA